MKRDEVVELRGTLGTDVHLLDGTKPDGATEVRVKIGRDQWLE